jgi:hypothetical protein
MQDQTVGRLGSPSSSRFPWDTGEGTVEGEIGGETCRGTATDWVTRGRLHHPLSSSSGKGMAWWLNVQSGQRKHHMHADSL